MVTKKEKDIKRAVVGGGIAVGGNIIMDHAFRLGTSQNTYGNILASNEAIVGTIGFVFFIGGLIVTGYYLGAIVSWK